MKLIIKWLPKYSVFLGVAEPLLVSYSVSVGIVQCLLNPAINLACSCMDGVQN